jgi:hypothetical protein
MSNAIAAHADVARSLEFVDAVVASAEQERWAIWGRVGVDPAAPRIERASSPCRSRLFGSSFRSARHAAISA